MEVKERQHSKRFYFGGFHDFFYKDFRKETTKEKFKLLQSFPLDNLIICKFENAFKVANKSCGNTIDRLDSVIVVTNNFQKFTDLIRTRYEDIVQRVNRVLYIEDDFSHLRFNDKSDKFDKWSGRISVDEFLSSPNNRCVRIVDKILLERLKNYKSETGEAKRGGLKSLDKIVKLRFEIRGCRIGYNIDVVVKTDSIETINACLDEVERIKKIQEKIREKEKGKKQKIKTIKISIDSCNTFNDTKVNSNFLGPCFLFSQNYLFSQDESKVKLLSKNNKEKQD
jgi:hypothetical protein